MFILIFRVFEAVALHQIADEWSMKKMLQKTDVRFMFYFYSALKDIMLWDTPRMIEHYRLALLRVVSGLFVMAGLEPGCGVLETLPRGVKYAILKVLRQAESATRRLIAVEARGLEMPDYIAPPKREKSTCRGAGERKSRAPRTPQFRLIDPRKFLEELYPNRRSRRAKARRERNTEPRLLFRIAGMDGQPDYEEWSDAAPDLSEDDALTAMALSRRMQALHHALNDLPKQAQRMAREIAKRKAAAPGPKAVPPLRGGFPPGHRKQHIHEVDEILETCHWLATREPEPPDRV